MSAKDNATSLLDKLKSSGSLSDCVALQESQRALPQVSANFDKLDQAEEKRVKKQRFGDELKFSVSVNLMDSKKAFNSLLAGLEDKDDFLGLWALPDHNPHDLQHPLKDIDPSVLDSLREKNTCEHTEQ